MIAKSAVLVVVDMQNGFISVESAPVVPVVVDLVDRWLLAGGAVVFTRYLMFTTENTDLVRQPGWTDIYVCGIAAEGCVLKTAVDAFELGLTPWVIEDASASHAGAVAHDAGVLVIKRFIGKGQILQVADIPGITSSGVSRPCPAIRTGRVANDQLGCQFDVQRVELMAFDESNQHGHGHPPQLKQRLADGGEQRRGGTAEIKVVEPGDGDICGHPQSALHRCAQGPDGHLVVEADQRRRQVRQVEQVTGSAVPVLHGRLHATQQGLRRQHPDVGEGSGMAGKPGVTGQPLHRAADHPDPAMPETDQVCGEPPRPSEVRG